MEENNEGLNEVTEEKVLVENEMPKNENSTKFKPLGQVKQEKPKKKKGKAGKVIFILLLLSAIIGGLAYFYFAIYTNPKAVYSQIIKTGVNSLMTPITEEITTLKTNMKLDVDIKLDETYMEDGVEDIIEIINNIDTALNMQLDLKEQEAILKLESNYDNEELLNMDMLMDVKNDKAYIKVDQFLDKVIETEDVDFTDIKDAFENLQETIEKENPTFGNDENRKKATEILKNELAKIIKDEYVSKTKENITLNGKEISADNYALKMTLEQIAQEVKTVCENLKNNEEFLNCFEEKEQLKALLENISEELKDAKIEQEAVLYVKIYRTGLMQENVRVDFEVEIDGEKLLVKIEKIDDKNAFDIIFKEEKVCTGTFKLENLENNQSKFNFVLNVENVGEFTVDTEYGYAINEELDKMDIENAVTTDEISETDILNATDKLQNSKLYELIEKFSGSSEDDEDELIGQPDLPTEEPDDDDDKNATDIEKNISSNGVYTESKKFIVFATNNNTKAVDMDIEVEYYDENGILVGSQQDYLKAVGAGNEVAVEMWDPPATFSTYKIYVDAEESEEIIYFDQIQITHNNNGKDIIVQAKNNSKDTIDYITVAVVYYNQGNVVGITDGIASEVKPGRSGNFTLHYPYDENYEDIEFDDYKVLVTEAYSYSE